MELNDSLFSIVPEALQAVDIYFAPEKSFAVVNPEMSVATAHEGIIASELIGIDDRTSFYGLDWKVEDRFSTYISERIASNKMLPKE